MTRLNLLLLIALMASSAWLVRTAYESRRLFSELDQAQSDERQLDSDFERLSAERQSQATPLRIQQVARDKLGMRVATPAVTDYVTDVAASSTSAGVTR